MNNCFTGDGPNPDPKRFEVLKIEQFDGYHVMKVRYPNCTNFEGNKVLLMPGTANPLLTHLDPHFSEDANSPIARFKPTEDGWLLAISVAEGLASTP